MHAVLASAMLRKKRIFKSTERGCPDDNLQRIEIEAAPIAINLDLYGDLMRARHMLYGYIRPLSTPSTSALSRYMLFIFPSWPPRRAFLFLFFPSFPPLFERSTRRDLPEDRGSLRLFSPFRFVHCVPRAESVNGLCAIAVIAQVHQSSDDELKIILYTVLHIFVYRHFAYILRIIILCLYVCIYNIYIYNN